MASTIFSTVGLEDKNSTEKDNDHDLIEDYDDSYFGTIPIAPTNGVITAPLSYYPQPAEDNINSLTLNVWYETPSRIRITLRDANNERWELPDDTLSIPNTSPTVTPDNLKYIFTRDEVPFSFTVSREDDTVIFDTTSDDLNSLQYKDQYIQFQTNIPTGAKIYGLGERIASWPLESGPAYTIWNMDWGKTPELKNLYGHHPVYMIVEDDGRAHIVVFRNSNMMDIFITANNTIVFKSVGGILDLYIIAADSPLDAISEYTIIVGRSFLPPRWSIGWHQCRWNYSTLIQTETVVNGYAENLLPLEVIWNDIDWMERKVAFTADPVNFPVSSISQFITDLKTNNQRYIQIMDPNIPAILGTNTSTSIIYYPYYSGIKHGIFVRHPMNDSLLYGAQWPPMPVVWPDWTHPNVSLWLRENLLLLQSTGTLPSGLWLDMNEPSSACPGGELSEYCIQLHKLLKFDSEWIIDPNAVPHSNYTSPIPYPEYIPGASYGQNIESRGFRIGSIHHLNIHYNVKDLLGMMEQRHVQLTLQNITNERSFSLSRSTFMGSGRYGAHWLGDNNSSWVDMKNSITSIFAMGIFGISMVGADICGFGGDTTAELCARWSQLGALYPFSRNHNIATGTPQEPYHWGEPYTSINRNSILLRYSLLSYFYSLYYTSHINGYPIWRATEWEFPTDSNAFKSNEQFFLGDALFVLPVVNQGSSMASGYLPVGKWYNYYTYAPILSSGESINLFCPLSTNNNIPMLIRGGYSFTIQNTSEFTGRGSLTTTDTVIMSYILIIALDINNNSNGYIYLDDGITIDSYENNQYNLINFTANFNNQSNMYLSSIPSIVGDMKSLVNITGTGINSTFSKIIILGVLLNDDANVTINTTVTYNQEVLRYYDYSQNYTIINGTLIIYPGLNSNDLQLQHNISISIVPIIVEVVIINQYIIFPIIVFSCLIALILLAFVIFIWGKHRQMKVERGDIYDNEEYVTDETIVVPVAEENTLPEDDSVITKKKKKKKKKKKVNNEDLDEKFLEVGQQEEKESWEQ